MPIRKRRQTHAEAGSSHQHVFSVDELAGPKNAPVPAFIHRVSDNRRRVYVEELAVQPPSPVKRMRMEIQNQNQAAPADLPEPLALFDPEGFSLDGERYLLFYDGDSLEPPSRLREGPMGKPVKPIKPSDPSLSNW
ncbi:hypothetical protein C8R45DRAFT_1089397 [Mycena sanguinolenta]|nr:hypothetical protein C8R45DRAFT_1089397 [Mycena sanguinolenta]